jgi:hypothetical protein
MRADVLLCDVVEMKKVRLASATMLVIALLAACASPAQPVELASVSGEADAAAAPLAGVASYIADGALLVEAVRPDRVVQPGADEVFDFKMVNTTGQPLSVVVALEHVDGQRWRTSLCVENQCLLGDGSEPSVTDPVILPPYLEQAFKAHLFVDAAARSGQQTALTLRVEPLLETAMRRSVTLSAQVGQP